MNPVKAFWAFLRSLIEMLVWKVQLYRLERHVYELETEERLFTIKQKIFKRQEEQRQYLERFKLKGEVLKQLFKAKKNLQDNCKHRKGGDCGSAFHGGGLGPRYYKGDTERQYSVVKHTFANGDTHIICLRCRKTWKPTDEDQDAYQWALNLETRNQTSTSIMFRFSDQGKHYASHIARYNA